MPWTTIKNQRGRPRSADGSARVTVSWRTSQRRAFILAVNLPDEVLAEMGWPGYLKNRDAEALGPVRVMVQQDGMRIQLNLLTDRADAEERAAAWTLQTNRKGPSIVAFTLPHLNYLTTRQAATPVVHEANEAGRLVFTLPSWARPEPSPEELAFELLAAGQASSARDLMEEFGWTQEKAGQVYRDWRKATDIQN